MLRRRVLFLIAILLTGAPVFRGHAGDTGTASGRLPSFDEALDRLIERLFPVPGHATEIGRRCLIEQPDWRDRMQLSAELQKGLMAHVTADRATILRRIDELRKDDFSANRTVLVDRWVLSRTEAQLCALLASR